MTAREMREMLANFDDDAIVEVWGEENGAVNFGHLCIGDVEIMCQENADNFC